MAPTLTAFDTVRAQIAEAALGAGTRTRVGAFTLREPQRQSVDAIQRALQAHGGALVADAVGSGKTVLALAVAAGYGDVLVLVPATVREQWQRAAARAEVSLRIASHESLSHGRAPPSAALIVVDEAHHFRTRSSKRYGALAALARGRHLLLLSATPVVNRRADRDDLLALFLGRRAVTPAVVERVVLRRNAERRDSEALRRLPPLQGASDVPGVAERLAALPPPLPTADGSAATALVRLTLAMAWSSSLSALDAALRRRLQRGRAIADVLSEGRWPSRDVLRDWILGDDATQLAIPFATPDAGRPPPRDAGATLAMHLEAVQALRQVIAPWIAGDSAARAAAIRALMQRESPRRVLVLAQHAVTIRALCSELRSEPGVVAIIGTRVQAAAGRWTRDEVLRALGPRQPAWRADDPRGIRLLLATDILAEGVELQGCATLIHADIPWTPARLEQRLGRVLREGQLEVVHEMQFALPNGAERLLALKERLQRKRRARTRSLGHADAVAALQKQLRTWRDPERAECGAGAPLSGDGPSIAFASAALDGFIAVLGGRDATQLLGGIYRDGRWHLSARADLLSSLVSGTGKATSPDRQSVHTARRVIVAWRRRQRARLALRDAPSVSDELLRRVVRLLNAWLEREPLARRDAAVTRVAGIKRGVSVLRGIAAETAIAAALRDPSTEAALNAIESLIADAPVAGSADTTRITALLILRRSPACPARRGSAPESAATR